MASWIHNLQLSLQSCWLLRTKAEWDESLERWNTLSRWMSQSVWVFCLQRMMKPEISARCLQSCKSSFWYVMTKLWIYSSIYTSTITCSIVMSSEWWQIQPIQKWAIFTIWPRSPLGKWEPLLLPIRRKQLGCFRHLAHADAFLMRYLWARTARRKPHNRTRTCWRYLISLLAWECLGILPEELEEMKLLRMWPEELRVIDVRL